MGIKKERLRSSSLFILINLLGLLTSCHHLIFGIIKAPQRTLLS
nr:MAG TPA: hypothetical protein [Caudoviricetes sp.]